MKTALLGYGVVGSGVHALTKARPEHGVTIARVLVRRDIEAVRAIATRDFNAVSYTHLAAYARDGVLPGRWRERGAARADGDTGGEERLRLRGAREL